MKIEFHTNSEANSCRLVEREADLIIKDGQMTNNGIQGTIHLSIKGNSEPLYLIGNEIRDTMVAKICNQMGYLNGKKIKSKAGHGSLKSLFTRSC